MRCAVWQVHETVAADHRIETGISEGPRLRVALLELPEGNNPPGQRDSFGREIEPDDFRASCQSTSRQYAGTAAHIQDARSSHPRRFQDWADCLAGDHAKRPIIACDVRIPTDQFKSGE